MSAAKTDVDAVSTSVSAKGMDNNFFIEFPSCLKYFLCYAFLHSQGFDAASTETLNITVPV